jgi:hypothetical protein
VIADAVVRYGGRAGVLHLGSLLRSGRPTGAKDLPDGPVDYRDLLTERVRGEYCVVARREALLEFPTTRRRAATRRP